MTREPKTVELRNTFHNTATRVNAAKFAAAHAAIGTRDDASARRYLKRIGNKLCGCSGCTCSGIDGVRSR